MVGNHGFVDGNKRTAWLVVEVLVSRSGYRIEITDTERLDDIVVAVAAGQVDFGTIVDWFKSRIRKMP